MIVQMTKFALKHFPNESKEKFTGTKITDMTSCDLVKRINDGLRYFDIEYSIMSGYAPFCEIIVMRNVTNAKTAVLPITLENYQWLRSGYVKRNDDEISYLSRWFDLPVPAPKAEYLHIIVYSKEQLELEQKDLPEDQKEKIIEWGIVTILAQNTRKTDPIVPSTMLRNAMGIEFGGSGVALDREEYEKSVEFWNTHAIVR